MTENNPLVSIIVITYNSAKYVCETLDSAISQTYKNIEVIISDDCSNDDTTSVCEKWIEEHNEIGIPLSLVKSDKNTGTSGNCNRGFKASRGEWIKIIGGDDILVSTAIEDYIDYVFSHPGIMHLVANLMTFTNDFKKDGNFQPVEISSYFYRDKMTWQRQYKAITKRLFIICVFHNPDVSVYVSVHQRRQAQVSCSVGAVLRTWCGKQMDLYLRRRRSCAHLAYPLDTELQRKGIP